MELPNAYGPNIFEHEGETHIIERHSGTFKIWTNKDGDNVFHMVDFSDGCYQAGLPVSLETLKAMRDNIDQYIAEAEKPVAP
jgi:hypothetical protein